MEGSLRKTKTNARWTSETVLWSTGQTSSGYIQTTAKWKEIVHANIPCRHTTLRSRCPSTSAATVLTVMLGPSGSVTSIGTIMEEMRWSRYINILGSLVGISGMEGVLWYMTINCPTAA